MFRAHAWISPHRHIGRRLGAAKAAGETPILNLKTGTDQIHVVRAAPMPQIDIQRTGHDHHHIALGLVPTDSFQCHGPKRVGQDIVTELLADFFKAIGTHTAEAKVDEVAAYRRTGDDAELVTEHHRCKKRAADEQPAFGHREAHEVREHFPLCNRAVEIEQGEIHAAASLLCRGTQEIPGCAT